MMIFDYVKYLGLYYGEALLQPLLAELGITKTPKLEKNDTTVHLSAKGLGVELCLKDEVLVKIPGKIFPEGALVLSNLTFFLKGGEGYAPFVGEIASGVTSKSTKEDVKAAFGLPDWPSYSVDGVLLPGEDDWNMRWDRADHCFFFTFTDEGLLSDVAIQLPLDQT